MTAPVRHEYLSTACWHELNDGRPELHASCRSSCKFAEGKPEYCSCPNHPENDDRPAPPPWVDQARDTAVRLLAVIREHNISLADAEPDLHEALLYDPRMFWLCGEAQPAGQWYPTTTNEENDR